MRERVAVATVQGKPYFLIVNQLKEQNIPFVSLIPGESVPIKVRLVITTEQEKQLVKHGKIVMLHDETELDNIINEAKKTLLGKKVYERIVIGLDPGEAIGLAILADGKVIDEENCYSNNEVIRSIAKTIVNIDFSQTTVTAKVGDGVCLYKELLRDLDDYLPLQVSLEIVGEAGTNKSFQEKKRSRRIRHISSAIRIAGRNGRLIERRKIFAAYN